jgi:hypothetical protein
LGKLTGGNMPPAALPGAIKTCELPGKKWVIAPLTDQSFCPHRAIGRKPHLLGVGTFLNGFPQGDGEAAGFCSPLAQFFACMYVQGMTQAVTQILGEVERLSETERQQLRRAIVERVPMSDDLTDDDFAALAADSFRALDEEENRSRA